MLVLLALTGCFEAFEPPDPGASVTGTPVSNQAAGVPQVGQVVLFEPKADGCAWRLFDPSSPNKPQATAEVPARCPDRWFTYVPISRDRLSVAIDGESFILDLATGGVMPVPDHEGRFEAVGFDQHGVMVGIGTVWTDEPEKVACKAWRRVEGGWAEAGAESIDEVEGLVSPICPNHSALRDQLARAPIHADDLGGPDEIFDTLPADQAKGLPAKSWRYVTTADYELAFPTETTDEESPKTPLYARGEGDWHPLEPLHQGDEWLTLRPKNPYLIACTPTRGGLYEPSSGKALWTGKTCPIWWP